MLVIREEQIEVFRRGVLRRFEDEVYAHLAKHFPDLVRELGEAAARERIRASLARGAEYRLSSRADLTRFVDLSFALGEEFDRHPWAQKILSGPLPARERVARLVEIALRRLPGRRR